MVQRRPTVGMTISVPPAASGGADARARACSPVRGQRNIPLGLAWPRHACASRLMQQNTTYRLTREDGEKISVAGYTWESALELGFLYGWKPAGTEPPGTTAWLHRSPMEALWDRGDYFSCQHQRVAEADACALSEAVLAALRAIPGKRVVKGPKLGAGQPGVRTPLPSRASAVADGLSESRRNDVRRVALFAACGAFTIGAA